MLQLPLEVLDPPLQDLVLISRAGDALVLLLTPLQRIGPSQVEVVAGDGSVRTVALTRVNAGTSGSNGTDENADPRP